MALIVSILHLLRKPVSPSALPTPADSLLAPALQQPQRSGPLPPHTGMAPRRLGAKLMSADEIESIMKIMYAAVTSGAPYMEDYYYQVGILVHTHAHAQSSTRIN